MSQSHIRIRGARTHNLKNVSLDIPRDKFVVITGLSGSGKSSLAFDTLYAEGQRRYVESLSAYARQFLSQMEKPEVDSIEGLSPAIAIEKLARYQTQPSVCVVVGEGKIRQDPFSIGPGQINQVPLVGSQVNLLTPNALVHDAGRVAPPVDHQLTMAVLTACPPADGGIPDLAFAFVERELDGHKLYSSSTDDGSAAVLISVS